MGRLYYQSRQPQMESDYKWRPTIIAIVLHEASNSQGLHGKAHLGALCEFTSFVERPCSSEALVSDVIQMPDCRLP